MKRILSKILFACIVFWALISLKFAILPYYFGSKGFESKLKAVQLDTNINTLFFGSSRIAKQLDPIIFDSVMQDFGLQSFNMAYGGVFNPESYFLYENFLQNLSCKRVKYVFIEIQKLGTLNKQTVNSRQSFYWNTLSVFNYSLNYINESEYPDSVKLNFRKFYFQSFRNRVLDFSILHKFRFKEDIKIENKGFEGFRNNQSINQKINRLEKDSAALNYKFLHRRLSEIKEIKAELSQINKINKAHLDYLSRIYNLSNEMGIKVFFILPPLLSKRTYLELIPLMKRFPENRNIELWDSDLYPEFYDIDNFLFSGYLNVNGSMIFSETLAEIFRTKEFCMEGEE